MDVESMRYAPASPKEKLPTTPNYERGLLLGRAYARRELADQTTNPEELRAHNEKAAQYERQAAEKMH